MSVVAFSSKEEGQSNFTNPGIVMASAVSTPDLMPELRLSFNANTLYFRRTQRIAGWRAIRAHRLGIGYDVSASLVIADDVAKHRGTRHARQRSWRDGFDALFPDRDQR